MPVAMVATVGVMEVVAMAVAMAVARVAVAMAPARAAPRAVSTCYRSAGSPRRKERGRTIVLL